MNTQSTLTRTLAEQIDVHFLHENEDGEPVFADIPNDLLDRYEAALEADYKRDAARIGEERIDELTQLTREKGQSLHVAGQGKGVVRIGSRKALSNMTDAQFETVKREIAAGRSVWIM